MSIVYYTITVLIWGTTWIAIHLKMQTGVSIDYALGFRFAMAGIILLPFLMKEARKLSFDRHMWILIQGLSFSGINFAILYYVSTLMSSGLMAIIYSSVVLFNVLNGAILFRSPIHPATIFGGIIGTCGLILVFLPDFIAATKGHPQIIEALALAFLATFIASIGNVTAAENQRQGVSAMCCAGLGMLYSGGAFILLGLLSGEPVTFPQTWNFWGPMVYLTIVNSIIAILCFFKLIRMIGPGRGAYVLVLTPIVALCISSFYEGFEWKLNTFAGISLILLGNIIAMLPQRIVGQIPLFKKRFVH